MNPRVEAVFWKGRRLCLSVLLIVGALTVASLPAAPGGRTADSASVLSGTVLNPDGTPARGATVVLVSGKPWHGSRWVVENAQGKPDPRGEGLQVVQTDRDGRFTLPQTLRPNQVFMLGEFGCGWTSVAGMASNSVFHLDPWMVGPADRQNLPLGALVDELSRSFSDINEWIFGVRDEPLIPEMYRRQGRVEGPFDSPSYQARQALIAKGTNAWPIIPLLVDNLFKSGRTARKGQYESAAVLARIGTDKSPYWPAMQQKLANRGEPVDVFSYFLAHDTVLHDKVDPVAQRFSLLALTAIGSPAHTALPSMLALTKSDSEDVRRLAWAAIGGLGAGGSNAAPVLEKMLCDPEEYPDVRIPAGVALAQIQPGNTNVLRIFREGLRDERMVMRVGSAEGLRQLGVGSEEYYPVLTNALDHKLVTVRYSAVHTLGRLGPRARDAQPLIEKLKTDESEKVRQAAIQALSDINGKSSQ